MAMITWKGEGDDGPRSNTWRGITFKEGQAVEIKDRWMIQKAKNNRFYEVTGDEEDDPQVSRTPPPFTQGMAAPRVENPIEPAKPVTEPSPDRREPDKQPIGADVPKTREKPPNPLERFQQQPA